MKDRDYFFCSQEVINEILFLYNNGMTVNDISICVLVTEDEIHHILDHILPYLD